EVAGDLDVLPLALRMVRRHVVSAADLVAIDQHLKLRVALIHVARHMQRQTAAWRRGWGRRGGRRESWRRGYIEGQRAIDVHYRLVRVRISDRAIRRLIRRLAAVDGLAVRRQAADIDVAVVTIRGRGAVPGVVDELQLDLMSRRWIDVRRDLDVL